METIIIEEENRKTIIDINKKVLKGNTFYHDGRIEPITKEVLDVFNIIFLSNNNKTLPNEGEYKVILDNETGFKHYYLNGVESYIMFFLNNGEELTICKVENVRLTDNGWSKETLSTKEKIFKVGKKIIHTTCMGLLCTAMFLTTTNLLVVIDNPTAFNDLGPYPILSLITGVNDYTVDDLINKIYSSDRLDTEDQLYLANRDFLEDILPYVNRYTAAKFDYSRKFHNIGIKTFDHDDNMQGYYRPIIDANSLYVSNDCLTDKAFNNVLSHEFIHLCQGSYYYNVITEATAEILSWEYYDDASLTSYPDEVRLVKKMMEIIGSEPILHYIIGGNFSYIEKEIKPYLTANEYHTFLYDLQRPNRGSIGYSEEKNKEKYASLDFLLDKVYEKKFNRKVEDDPVIPYIGDKFLVRYYFNSKKIKEEGSYLITPIPVDTEMSLEEAVKKDYVMIAQQDDDGNFIEVSFEEYMNSTYDTSRNIIYIGKQVSFRGYLGEDDKIHIVITRLIDGPKTPLSSVDEKIEELSNRTK